LRDEFLHGQVQVIQHLVVVKAERPFLVAKLYLQVVLSF
jgi:hypothetical protein